MIDKGKKPSNGEEDDFLKMMMDYDKQYQKAMVSARFPGSMLNAFSKGDCSVSDKTDVAEHEADLSKFLSLSSTGFVDLSSSSSKLPTNDLESMIHKPEMAEQNQVAVPGAATTARPITALRKYMSPDVLARLSRQDPKKARRVITNRISAVRSKEKKKLYTYMLEHKLQTLQTEAAASNAHLDFLEAENMDLNSENARLKEEADMIIGQINFQELLNDGLRSEIQKLRMLIINQHQGEGMVLNNVNQNNNNLQTEQVFPTIEYHHRHHQVEQLGSRVQQMNIGQHYPWQLQQFNQELPAAGIQQINLFSNYQQQQDERNH